MNMRFTLSFLLMLIFGTAYSQRQISEVNDIADYATSFGANYVKGLDPENTKEYLPVESFTNPWPNPQFNFKQFVQTPLELGDVNGDGFSDILMVYENIADERTDDPNDVTSKSIIYYGSSGSVTPSHLFYCHIVPAGDINKDGISDVVMLQKGVAKIYYGGTSGFVESGIPELPGFTKSSLSNLDFDQDGFLDFVYIDSSTNIVFVWGNSDESLISFTVTGFSSFTGISAIKYATQPILFFDSCYLVVQGNRDVYYYADNEIRDYRAFYEDLDADGVKEFFLCSRTYNTLYLYQSFDLFSGINKVGRKSIVSARLLPVGDLNKDGKFDFLNFDYLTLKYNVANVNKTNPLSLELLHNVQENIAYEYPSDIFIKSDINKDGNEDIVYCYSNGSESGICSLSFVSGGFLNKKLCNASFTPGFSYRDLVNAKDINKDGLMEIIGVTDSLIYIFSNNDLSTPSHIIQRADENLTYQKAEVADLNNDGYMDFVVQATDFADKSNTELQFFYGGDSFPLSPLKRINYVQSLGVQQEVNSNVEMGFSIIGSVDGDIYPEILAFSSHQPDTVYMYKGAVDFPTTPAKMFSYKGNLGDPTFSATYFSSHTGSRAFNLGDLNDDGFSEFCMYIDKRTIDNKKTGAILVFNGNEDLDFSIPSKILYDKRTDVKVSKFGIFLAVGDFNGDCKLDIATASYEIRGSVSGPFDLKFPNLSIYYGRPVISDTPDELFYLTANNIVNVSIDTLNSFSGYLMTVPDINGDKADELVVFNQLNYSITTSSGTSYNNSISNYLFMGGQSFVQSAFPLGIFSSPYSRARLGGTNIYYFSDFAMPIVDFSGKGIPELICIQNDPNYFGQTLHRYVITNPFNSAPMGVGLTSSSIMENMPVNSVVGDLNTVDVDKTDYHTYELSAEGGNSYDNNLFKISSNKLESNAVFNFEEKSTYQVFIKTTDASGLSASKLIDVNVTNQNEPVLSASLSNNFISENEPEGTLIGVFSATDTDADDTHTFEFATGDGTNDSGNNLFKIEGNVLKVKNPLDYETSSTQNIYVRVKDTEGLFIDVPFIINVINVVEVGINDNLFSNLTMRPNPAIDFVEIVIPDGTASIKFSMIDALGRVVKQEMFPQKSVLKIDLHGLNKGMYVVLLEQNGSILQGKLIIQ